MQHLLLEVNKEHEKQRKSVFQNQDAILKQMAAKGQAIVKGGSGRTAGKVYRLPPAELGRTQSALAESLMSAQTNTRAANLNIDLKKAIADKNADANLMLDPELYQFRLCHIKL